MIAYVRGKLVDNLGNVVILDVNGLGYSINVPSSVQAHIKGIDEEIKLHTYYSMAGDQKTGKIIPQLYGFWEKGEKRLFEKLITVSGIGPKAALNMLSTMDGASLALAIVSSDVKTLMACKGVGKKTAERIVLELKEKIDQQVKLENPAAFTLNRHIGMGVNQVIDALMALGYTQVEARTAFNSIEVGEETDTSALVKLALKTMDMG